MKLTHTATALAIASVLACGPATTGEAPGPGILLVSPSPPVATRTEPPAAAAPSTPPSGARPTESPSSTSAPTALPGEAWVIVKVIDGSSFAPIPGATVRIDAYQVQGRTDASGMVEFNHLRVAGQCRWITIAATAPGYGVLEVVDNPLYPLRVTFDFRLTTYDQRSYIGAPKGSTGGESFCSR